MAERPAQALGHEEIVKVFLGTGAVNFAALGKFVAEYGESIAISGRGDYGVRIGWYNILACFKLAGPTIRPNEILESGIAGEVLGR
jgi:hypothetical protein